MALYRFDEIAINCTAKRMPKDGDQELYIGLEHLDAGSLRVNRWGSAVPIKGEKLIMQKGDVLFGKRNAYLRRAAIAPHDGIFSAHGMVLQPKEEVIDKEFFPLFIASDYFFNEAIRISVGSLSPTVNWKDLRECTFELPSLEDQKKLAKVLWAANKSIESYKKLLKMTDELVKSQFIEMFGNPILNNKGWDFEPLPKVATIVLGTTPSSSEPEFWDGNVKWITPAELQDDTFEIFDSVRHITEKGVKSAGLRPFPKGTVIFSTRAPIGKTAIAGCEMYCNQGFKNFICGEKLNPVYLYAALRINKDYFINLGTGNTFKELSKARLEQISISVPPIELQNEFEEIFRQSDKSKFELEQSLAELTATYKRIISENLG